MKFFTKGLLAMLLIVAFAGAGYATSTNHKEKAHGPPGYTVAHDCVTIDATQVHCAQLEPSLGMSWRFCLTAETSTNSPSNDICKKPQRMRCNYRYVNIQKYYSCGNRLSA